MTVHNHAADFARPRDPLEPSRLVSLADDLFAAGETLKAMGQRSAEGTSARREHMGRAGLCFIAAAVLRRIAL